MSGACPGLTDLRRKPGICLASVVQPPVTGCCSASSPDNLRPAGQYRRTRYDMTRHYCLNNTVWPFAVSMNASGVASSASCFTATAMRRQLNKEVRRRTDVVGIFPSLLLPGAMRSRELGPRGAMNKGRRCQPCLHRTVWPLERLAREHGSRQAHPETTDALPEAIALYRSSGYVEVPCHSTTSRSPTAGLPNRCSTRAPRSSTASRKPNRPPDTPEHRPSGQVTCGNVVS